jgi:RNA polymerase sigma factor (sigma-70 family)
MATKTSTTAPRKARRYVVAMVLGTALSALGATQAVGSSSREAESRAINDISRYCTVCWRNARLDPECWNDCTQEVFCRLLERVTPDAWGQMLKGEGEERREFLRAIDAVKKRTQRNRRWANPLAEETIADRSEVKRQEITQERAVLDEAASRLLTPRQQKILEMSAEGWSVQEIGSRLQMTPARVSDEKYKAVCKLREHFADEITPA